MIRKSKGGGYEVRSKKTGKRLSRTGMSKEEAAKRIQEIEYFKRHPKK